MHCACGIESPDGAKFCVECGQPLLLSCPTCRAHVASGANFCSECGARLLATASNVGAHTPLHLAELILRSRTAIEGERKQVTVLFCDVTESMSLAAALDAEEWRRIMSGLLDVLSEGVHRFEGTVNQFTGDGMMALFGAPIAHEDHARRACHAALHLSQAVAEYTAGLDREMGLTFDVRFGLNSGEVVVGAIGDDLHMKYTAIGHTVGLAQRMEALADPGCVYLTEHTARLVAGWFDLQDLGPQTVKGGGAPFHVYVLNRPRAVHSSYVIARARGLSPLIGRKHEMTTLESALARAQDGSAQVVGVVGEPGVGKSRLCEEFAQRCAARGITVRRGHGLSYGKHMPLQPILEFFRDYFEIVESDTPQQARDKIAGPLVSFGASIDDDLPVFFDFMEVSDPQHPLPQMGAEERMHRIFDLVRRVTPRRSERSTLVLLFEDLQWFDAASEAFLEELIESYPGTRTLIITNFRPEFQARWMRHSFYRQIALSPLGTAEARAMVGALVGEDPALGPLVDSLTERTSGNPFFLEEVIRSLIEDGTLERTDGGYTVARSRDRLGVPATVQAVVGARIDRLAEHDKEILQTASVIGRTFSAPILRRVAGRSETETNASLRRLCSAEFLSAEAVDPAPEYRFWHPLTQEVAYGSLLAEHRRRIHAAVATALLERHPEGSGDHAALIAHHWQEAGEAALAARWHWRAAEWAQYRDSADSLRRWRVMIELLSGLDATPERTELGVMARARLLRFVGRMGLSNEDRHDLYEQGRLLAERSEDMSLLARLIWSYGASFYMGGQLRDARTYVLAGTQIADEIGDVGLSVAFRIGAVIPLVTGPLSTALHEAQIAIDLTAGDSEVGTDFLGYSPLVRSTINRSMICALMGRLDEARADAEAGLVAARERAELENVVIGLYAMNLWAFLAGDAEGAIDRAREPIQVMEMSTRYLHTYAWEGMGMAFLLAGRPDDARHALENGPALFGQGVGGFQQANTLALLSAAHASMGDAQQAFASANEAVEAARVRGTLVWAGHALMRRAYARRLRGEDEALVADEVARSLAAIEEAGAYGYLPLLDAAQLRPDQ